MVINISLRMLHSSKQPAWQRPLVAALQDTLRTTPVGAWFFGQLANAKVGGRRGAVGSWAVGVGCMHAERLLGLVGVRAGGLAGAEPGCGSR
jgi:hypothetical protein